MTATRTVEEKVADWYTAYEAIRHSITPPEFRPLLALMGTEEGKEPNVQSVNLGIAVARIVLAGDRQAGLIAGMLTTNGVKITPSEDSE